MQGWRTGEYSIDRTDHGDSTDRLRIFSWACFGSVLISELHLLWKRGFRIIYGVGENFSPRERVALDWRQEIQYNKTANEKGAKHKQRRA